MADVAHVTHLVQLNCHVGIGIYGQGIIGIFREDNQAVGTVRMCYGISIDLGALLFTL
jgi:hypothetical protein